MLREEGFLALNVPKKWGGAGVGLLGHTIAFEALAQGCPSTALAFNMHASVVMPVLESAEIGEEVKARLADLVVRQGRLIGGNFSEPGHTSLIGERPLERPGAARGRRLERHRAKDVRLDARSGRLCDGARLSRGCDDAVGRHPAADPAATHRGGGVIANWDVLGMRATRSDSLVLEDCRVPDARSCSARTTSGRSVWRI